MAQTAMQWLEQSIAKQSLLVFMHVQELGFFEQAKQMELEQRKEDFKVGYTQGYLDAQCNHINDADNFANEQEYLNSRESDIEITDYIIGPFGTPEKL